MSTANTPNWPRNPTRAVSIGSITIGAGSPIAVQSMCATKTTDVSATVAQIEALRQAGADIVRVAADTRADAAALAEVRDRTDANLSVDLQENYRLAEAVAPFVDKIRYNPGHLYHHQKDVAWPDKVRYLAEVASRHGCAIRVGVNCGSIDPEQKAKFSPDDRLGPMLAGALEHCALLDRLGFDQYCVSLKDSDWRLVVEANRRFAAQRPDVPLHLGVTEAGMPPEGVLRTQWALQELIPRGIGDTIRVSLTVPGSRKHEEIEAAKKILGDIAAGRRCEPPPDEGRRLNIVSCPSCARVENEAFVALAEEVRRMAQFAESYPITIAVMGCRVNGPGETDSADLGLWCGPSRVHLKRGAELIGAFSYDEILPRLQAELEALIARLENRKPH